MSAQGSIYEHDTANMSNAIKICLRNRRMNAERKLRKVHHHLYPSRTGRVLSRVYRPRRYFRVFPRPTGGDCTKDTRGLSIILSIPIFYTFFPFCARSNRICAKKGPPCGVFPCTAAPAVIG